MMSVCNIRRRPTSTGSGAWPQDLHPVLRRIYAQRGIEHPHQIESSLARLHTGDVLSNIDAALNLLVRALEIGQRIVVIGDYDADGATSTALALRALRAFGARDVHYLVPNRFEFGYGLTPGIVEVAAGLEPDLLITVDNGVASVEGVARAKARGMRVLVTDHHLAGETLPAADAIVNPNLPGDAFPSKHLAGVGVIFYVMLILRGRLRETGWFERKGIVEPNLAELLDLVALGTVADVAPLDHNNRILVEQGLRRIRAGRCAPGIRALLEVARRDPRCTVAADLGFAVGPRLNAAGRLRDMALGVECLLSDDEQQAKRLARELDALNRERRQIGEQMQAEALTALDALSARLGSELPSGLCLYDPGWHQGVIGILAGRLKDRLHRPVIAFAAASDGEMKGSARSIPGLHIRDVLAEIAARYPGLIDKFGGHAMAAGLSLPLERLDAFTAAFAEMVERRLSKSWLDGVIHSDGELLPGECCLETAECLRYAGPWGQGFEEPLFDGVFEVLGHRTVGERHLKLRLRMTPDAPAVDAIAFNIETWEWRDDCQRVNIAYRLDVNEYRGQRGLQLVIKQLQALEA